jgi:two-component system response regulator HupR/HoxA
VIAATNRNLEDEVRAGRFRADLYYRLAGIVVRLPDLKDRPADIPVLAKALLSRAISLLGKRVSGLTQEALDCMQAYSWPGNVREMQNEIQQMLVMGEEGNELGADLLSRHILQADPVGREEEDLAELMPMDGSLKDRIGELEARIIKETLIRHRWNKSKAARELGLSRVGLRGKLERYGLENVKPLPAKRKSAGAAV